MALRGERGQTGPPSTPGSGTTGEQSLRILVHVNHPAQVHLFRTPIARLQARGHEVLVTSRDKEVTLDLLDAYGIDHRPLTTKGESVPTLLWELLQREVRMLAIAREFQPDVVVSRLSPAAAHVSTAVGAPFVAFNDTRIDASRLRRVYQGVTFPFVERVCAPASFDLPVDPERRQVLDFQELSYLHPRYFEPDPEVLREHGLDPDEPYFVVRTAGWDAFHDVGHAGLSAETIRDLIDRLTDHGTVYVSAEGRLPDDLGASPLPTPPEHIHHALYYADCYVGDSGTMSSEAAILGTPAVRTSSMVGEDDEDIFHALAEYGLLESHRDEQDALAAVESIVEGGVDREQYRARREQLVADQPDVAREMVRAILETAGDHDETDEHSDG